jgi:hypothetical protein
MVSKFYIKTKWQDVKDWFNPRQKWLTKVIPNHWCDKTELVPLVLFAILVDFVEKENGLDQLTIDWDQERAFVSQEYIDSVMSSCLALKEAYDYIKTERPLLDKALADSYPDIDLTDTIKLKQPYHIAYAETNRLEKELEEKDLKTMTTIVKHWQFLWT